MCFPEKYFSDNLLFIFKQRPAQVFDAHAISKALVLFKANAEPAGDIIPNDEQFRLMSLSVARCAACPEADKTLWHIRSS